VKRIPIAGPSITEVEVAAVTEAVRTAWYDNAGAFNRRFEEAFALHCGRAHAVSLPSCTSGLHLALAALGVGGGDEVILPEATWIASAAPVDYVGATPVFADIDPHSWCLSPDAFEAAITPRTKAAIVVDLYGSMPDWDALARIAGQHGIALIEDAAHPWKRLLDASRIETTTARATWSRLCLWKRLLNASRIEIVVSRARRTAGSAMEVSSRYLPD